MFLKNMVDFSKVKLIDTKLQGYRFVEDTYEVELLTGLFEREIEDDLYRYDRNAEIVQILPDKLIFKIKR